MPNNLCSLMPVLLSLLLSLGAPALGNPLDDYVNLPDPEYKWKHAYSIQAGLCTMHVLELQSQRWRTQDEVDRPLWKHWLTIIQPNTVKFSTAMLLIEGGSKDSNPPNLKSEAPLIITALATQSVICEIKMIPNQPIKFFDEFDPRYKQVGRKEDALIAYTWDKYLKVQDPFWVARLPMAKAVVKAMDAIQSFTKDRLQLNLAIDRFVLAGASKRGWTCWTTAAVDSRIKALIPIVIDLLNVKTAFTRQYKAYGTWSDAIHDYLDIHLPERWNTPAFDSLMKLEDPLSYRSRLTAPKYIINATGDDFFLPDSSQQYFHELLGQNYLRYVPNADHKLEQNELNSEHEGVKGMIGTYEGIVSYYQAILEDAKLPHLSWQRQSDANLLVRVSPKPLSINLWQASNENGRDFRLKTIGKAWKATPLELTDKDTYIIPLAAPNKGWRAHMVEVVFENKGKAPLTFTTDVFVTPDTFPFPGPN